MLRAPAKKTSREVSDMLGRKVNIPVKVENIVALNAGMLRLIAWMEATDLVCGIEYNETRRQVPYLYANPQLTEKPVIGMGNNPDTELLTAMAPDLIFVSYFTPSEADRLQTRTGIPVLAIKYGNFDDEIETVFETLRFLGEILERETRAKFLSTYIRETIVDLKYRSQKDSSGKAPMAYIGGISYRGSHGITSTEPRYPSFRFLNIQNVAAALPAVMTSPRDNMINAFIDPEQLIEWNPEYIFLDMSSTTYSGNMLDEPWIHLLDAVNQDKAYTVLPYNWYTTNYSTILVNSYFIGKWLYPEQFKDIDPEQKAREIYTKILGGQAYDKMIEKFGPCQKIKMQEKSTTAK
jgi:iron complex transport system substrate-binding protein